MKRYVTYGLILILLGGCGWMFRPKASASELEMVIESRCFELQTIYPSRPITAFLFPDKVDRFDMGTFIQVAHIRPNAAVEQFDWEEAFQAHIKDDKSGKWKELKHLLESYLSDVTVFRTKGNGVTIEYLLGRYDDQFIGIKTITVTGKESPSR